MSVVKHQVVSTGGDFITNSGSFVEIPDTRLVFQVEDQSTVAISAVLGIWGNPSEVALMVDEAFIQTLIVADTKYQFYSCQVAFNLTLVVPAGVHTIGLFLRALEGCRDETPEGPREWSPRKKKKREKEPIARVIRSPEMPISITAIVV